MTVIAKSSPGSARFQGIAGHLVENYVGYAREIAFGLDANREIKDLRVFDGVTPGGHIVWPASASALTNAGIGATIYARNHNPINSPEHNIGDLWIHPLTGHIFIYREAHPDLSSSGSGSGSDLESYINGYWEDLGNFKGGDNKVYQDDSYRGPKTGEEFDRDEGGVVQGTGGGTLYIAYSPPPSFLGSAAEESSVSLYDSWYDVVSGGFWQLLALSPTYPIMADKSFYEDLDTDRIDGLTCIRSVVGSGDGDYMPFAWIYLGKSKTPEFLADYAMPPREPDDTVVAGDYYFDEFSGRLYTYRIATEEDDIENYDAPISLPYYWSYSADLYHPTLFNDDGPPPIEKYTEYYRNTSYYDNLSRRIYRLEDFINDYGAEGSEMQTSPSYDPISNACYGVESYDATFKEAEYRWSEVGNIVASEAFFGSLKVDSAFEGPKAKADIYYDSHHRYYSKVIEQYEKAYNNIGWQYVEPYLGEWQKQSAVVAGDFFTGTGSPSFSTRPYDIYYDEDERIFHKYEPDSYLSYSLSWTKLDQIVAGDFFTGTGSPSFSTRPYDIYYDENERVFYKYDSSSSGWVDLDQVIAGDFSTGTGPPSSSTRPYDIYYDENERVFYKYDSSSSSWTDLDQVIATHFMFGSETTALSTPRPNDVKYVNSDSSFYKYLNGSWELMATIGSDFFTGTGPPSFSANSRDVYYDAEERVFYKYDSSSGWVDLDQIVAGDFLIGEGDPIVENPTTARQFDIYYDKSSSRIWKYDVTDGWGQETYLGGGSGDDGSGNGSSSSSGGNKWVVIPATSIFTPASVWWGYEVNFFYTPIFDYATGSYVFESGKTQSLIIRFILPDSYKESPNINIYANLGMHYPSETTLEIISAHNFTSPPNTISNTLSVSSASLPDGTGPAAKFDTISGGTYSLAPGGTIATKLTCSNPSSDRKFTGLIVTW